MNEMDLTLANLNSRTVGTLITLHKAVLVGATVAFIALVMLTLVYSVLIIINWHPILAVIFLLLLYSILYPFAVPLIPSNIGYWAYLPASFCGLEISLIFWFNRYGILEPPVVVGSILLAFCMLALTHYWTRKGLVIYRKFLYGGLGLDLKRITRVGAMMVTPFFIVMSATFSNPEIMNLPSYSLFIVVLSLIVLYATFSVLGLNVAYRIRLLDGKLHAKDYTSKIGHLEAELIKRHPKKLKTISFFSFVLRSAVDDFAYGDYDKAFLDSYRIVHDKIIQNPKEIVKNKVGDKTLEEYRRIRVFLIHGFLEEKKSRLEVPITVEDVVWAKKVLFQKTLDLIELAFYVAAEI